MSAHIVGSQVLRGDGAGTDNVSLVTDAAVPAGKRVLLSLAYFSDNNDSTISSIFGGGLTWTIDRSHINANFTNKRTSIASASAPSGMPLGTTLAITWDMPDVWAMLRVYWLDELPHDSVPNGGASGAGLGDAWSMSTIDIDAPSVAVATHWTDYALPNNTPTDGSTEAWEFPESNLNWVLVAQYKSVSSDFAASGTWVPQVGQGWQGTSVAYLLSSSDTRDVYEGGADVYPSGLDVLHGPQDIL